MTGWTIHCRHEAQLFEEQEQGVLIQQIEVKELDWEHAIEANGQKPLGVDWELIGTYSKARFRQRIGHEWDYPPHIKPETKYWVPQVSHLARIDGRRIKGRMSFFKRLAWQKGGKVADHEDIIFARRREKDEVSVHRG